MVSIKNIIPKITFGDTKVDSSPQKFTQVSVYVPESELLKTITEKAIVGLDDIQQPFMEGVAHPFNFKLLEDTYNKYGFVTAAIDKHIDFIVGQGFYVTSDDESAQKIIDNFLKKTNFDDVLRVWIREALIKGNGF